MSVLGPLRVEVGGRRLPLTTRRLRTMLVGLAMSAGRAVSVDELTHIVWDDEPPNDPRRSLQTYAARLRGVVGIRLIETVTAGWLLRADPDDVDALRFARLLDEAAAAVDTDVEKGLLAEALTLWRGDPFEGAGSDWLCRAQRPRLLERHLAALERRVDLDIRDGADEALIAELETLTARYPLRESLWVRLLTVLDRCGRPAEALQRYETVRRRIAEELGTDPSAELRELYARLLAGEPADGTRQHIAFPVTPRQLPSDGAGFAGRRAALATLDHLLAARRAGQGPGVAVVAGGAGVGKTALAIRWANRVAPDFPDGQLYWNLRGFEANGSPVAPDQVIRGFLAALGVAPHDIPSDLDGQVAVYRSITAGRRLLVVLDNASSAEQVRPLLLGGDRGLVVVTSRNRLTGLVVADGAQPVPLDVLPVDEAWEMLHRRLNLPVAREVRVAVDEIIRLCSGLPLALAVIAARLAMNPDAPVAALCAELRDSSSRLDLLDSGDEATSVRAAFSWSYDAVSPEAARLFRLSGLHPGPELSLATAANLGGISLRRARQLLAELVDAHLLTETAPGRYALHALLRVYAQELAEQLGPDRRPVARFRPTVGKLRAVGESGRVRDAAPLRPAG